MSLDDAERDDMGVENPLGIGLEDSGKEDVKEKNPHDQLTVAAALSCIAGRDRFADVYFAVGTGKEQRRIPGHRVILAAASDIFEAMLFPTVFPDDVKAAGKGAGGGAGGDKDVKGDAAPASAAASAAGAGAGAGAAVPLPAMGMGLGLGLEDPNAEIEVPDVKPHVFRTMLSSIYGDSADIKAEDLPDLIACARKFQVESLRLQCVKFMTEGVTVDNACGLFESAEKLLNEKQFALQFIEDNAAEVLAHPSFDALSRERVATILRSNKLAIDEIDLFKAVLRWSVAECKRQGVKEKDLVEAKKKCVAELIPLVRFPLMAMEDVATFVSPSNILTPPQLLEVFTYLGQPDNRKPKTQFNAQPRVGNSDKWTFEPAANLHSASITFAGVGAGKNMTAKNNSINHSYCLGSVAWTKGAHAWRVTRDQGQTQWLLLGVSRKEAHADSSSTAAGFYGMSSANQRFMAGAQAYVNSNFMTGPLDVLYDADAGSLAIFNHSNGQRFDMNGIPKGQPLCPHFGPHSNQQLTVKPIRPKDFARK